MTVVKIKALVKISLLREIANRLSSRRVLVLSVSVKFLFKMALQTLCFNFIKTHFNYYFKITEDCKLKSDFEFFQRNFPYELASKHEEYQIKMQYNFFRNEQKYQLNQAAELHYVEHEALQNISVEFIPLNAENSLSSGEKEQPKQLAENIASVGYLSVDSSDTSSETGCMNIQAEYEIDNEKNSEDEKPQLNQAAELCYTVCETLKDISEKFTTLNAVNSLSNSLENSLSSFEKERPKQLVENIASLGSLRLCSDTCNEATEFETDNDEISVSNGEEELLKHLAAKFASMDYFHVGSSDISSESTENETDDEKNSEGEKSQLNQAAELRYTACETLKDISVEFTPLNAISLENSLSSSKKQRSKQLVENIASLGSSSLCSDTCNEATKYETDNDEISVSSDEEELFKQLSAKFASMDYFNIDSSDISSESTEYETDDEKNSEDEKLQLNQAADLCYTACETLKGISVVFTTLNEENSLFNSFENSLSSGERELSKELAENIASLVYLSRGSDTYNEATEYETDEDDNDEKKSDEKSQLIQTPELRYIACETLR